MRSSSFSIHSATYLCHFSLHLMIAIILQNSNALAAQSRVSYKLQNAQLYQLKCPMYLSLYACMC
jgi:hypothetical protein